MARHHTDPDAAFWGWCDVWLDPAFAHWSLVQEASRLRAPTLLIQGAQDPYGTLAQIDEIEARARGRCSGSCWRAVTAPIWSMGPRSRSPSPAPGLTRGGPLVAHRMRTWPGACSSSTSSATTSRAAPTRWWSPRRRAEKARGLLDAFRAGGELIIHLKHIRDAPDAPFMRPGTDGVEIHPLVAPADGEPVIEKEQPNGFIGTGLAVSSKPVTSTRSSSPG